MGAFTNGDLFAIEFSIRTQINYLFLLRQEIENNPALQEHERISSLAEIDNRVADLNRIVTERGFRHIEFCCGTQLMNSVLGLLVYPQQELFNDISDYTDRTKWEEDFPRLSDYIFGNERGMFESSYMVHYGIPERISPRIILKHMRNAVSHRRIMLYPINANGGDQVTDIVFLDERQPSNTNATEKFKLQIHKYDLDRVLLEISNYFINREVIRERDRRTRNYR